MLQYLGDERLSLKAKGLYAMLLSLQNKSTFSIASVSEMTKDGATAIKSAIKELEENRYLIRRSIKENGKFVRIQYILFDEEKISLENS